MVENAIQVMLTVIAVPCQRGNQNGKKLSSGPYMRCKRVELLLLWQSIPARWNPVGLNHEGHLPFDTFPKSTTCPCSTGPGYARTLNRLNRIIPNA